MVLHTLFTYSYYSYVRDSHAFISQAVKSLLINIYKQYKAGHRYKTTSMHRSG
jgi:hypothetical protein